MVTPGSAARVPTKDPCSGPPWARSVCVCAPLGRVSPSLRFCLRARVAPEGVAFPRNVGRTFLVTGLRLAARPNSVFPAASFGAARPFPNDVQSFSLPSQFASVRPGAEAARDRLSSGWLAVAHFLAIREVVPGDRELREFLTPRMPSTSECHHLMFERCRRVLEVDAACHRECRPSGELGP